MIFKKAKNLRIYAVLIILLSYLYMHPNDVFKKENLIGPGKPYATPYYIIESKLPGPVICIIGGTHGNEPAGYRTAEKLLQFKPDYGKLIIIPRANIRAVRRNWREIPEEGDLNRCYPGNKTGSIMERFAFELLNFMREKKIDLLIDLHESLDYYLTNKDYLGQTIIAYQNEKSIWIAGMAIERINTKIKREKEQFSLLKNPIRGSTAWAGGKYLKIPAFSIETCKKLSLASRTNYMCQLVGYILEEVGVKLICN